MRALAFSWLSFVGIGLARRTYSAPEGNQHRRPAFEVDNRAGASSESTNFDALTSLFFAVNPGVAADLRANSAIGRTSFVRSRQQGHNRQSRLAKQLPRMAFGDVSEVESEHAEEPNDMKSKMMSSALAAAFAFAPLLASAAPPDIYKVDKTGFIGGIASLIESGIDLAHDGLANAGVAGAYGFSIILFTLLIKTITLPLLNIQLESTTKMQAIQPIQKRIMESYGTRQEMEKNLMLQKLFQVANVNPFASLLPAFAQIPIFISLYRALQNLIAEDKLEESFLWIPSLEGPVSGTGGLDWLTSVFSGNPTWGYEGTAAFLSLTAILYVVQTLSIKLAQPARDPNKKLTEQEEQAQTISTVLPLLICSFSLSVPAGLSIYWIWNSIFTTIFSAIGRAKYANDGLPDEVQGIIDELDNLPKPDATESRQFQAYKPTDSNVNVKVKKPGEPLEAETVTVQAQEEEEERKPFRQFKEEDLLGPEPVEEETSKPKKKKRAQKEKSKTVGFNQ